MRGPPPPCYRETTRTRAVSGQDLAYDASMTFRPPLSRQQYRQYRRDLKEHETEGSRRTAAAHSKRKGKSGQRTFFELFRSFLGFVGPSRGVVTLSLATVTIATGLKLWEHRYDFRRFDQAFYLSASQGVLIAVGTSGAYHVHAFDGSTGSPLWQHTHEFRRDHHGGGMQHPVILDGVVYVDSKGLDLHRGVVRREDLPERRGCGTMSASGNSLFFRHYDHTVWDLVTNKTTTLTGLRSGCWLSMIPAGGLLLAPEASSGCSCANPIQASVAYRPKENRPKGKGKAP